MLSMGDAMAVYIWCPGLNIKLSRFKLWPVIV